MAGSSSRPHNSGGDSSNGALPWQFPLNMAINSGSNALGLHQSASSSSMSSEGFCDNDAARDTDSMQPDSGQVSRQNSQNSRDSGAVAAVRSVRSSVNVAGGIGNNGSANPGSGNRALQPAFGGRTVGVSYHGAAEVSVAQWLTSHPNPANLQRPHNHMHQHRSSTSNVAPNFDEELEPGASAHQHAITVNPQDGSGNHQDNVPAAIPDIFSNLKRLEDPSEILFARAEGLHAHGHVQEASKLAVRLAEELLANPPNLMLDLPHPSTNRNKRKKVRPPPI